MGGGGGSSKSYSTYNQTLIDPEAAKRMADVAERTAAIAEEQWSNYKQVFRPYEREMARSNMRLISPNEKLARESLESSRRLLPYREAASRDSLRGISDDIRAARPVVKRFYEEAVSGVDARDRMQEAQADVAQQFGDAMGMQRRNLSRMGVNANDAARSMGNLGLERAKATAGAMTGARRAAEQESFGRLQSAMSARAGSIGLGTSVSPYRGGETQLGNYTLQSPANQTAQMYGLGISANQAGMGTLSSSRSRSKSSSWNFGL